MSARRPLPLDAIGVGLAAGFLLAIAAGAVASLGESDPPPPPTPEQTEAAVIVAPAAATDPVRRTAVVRAVEQVAPAVVSITTESPAQDPFFGRNGRTTSSEGSGVVIAADGVVLTNNHVVEGAARIVATFADGRGYDADVVGLAPELDLAVLRLRGATGLAVAPPGTSSDLMLGEPVVAIGNPFGLGHTVTTGVISAVSRPLATDDRVYQDFIQTDASINPGNSGGPLINARGQLVGINTAVRADGQGIGFAIPADRALKVARDLVDFGAVQVPWLGLDLSDVIVRSRDGRVTAPRVDHVHADSAAEAAGIRPGMILVAVDGRGVQGRADLNAWLAGFEPGHTVEVELLDEGRGRRVSLEAGRVPDAVVERSLARVLGVQIGEDAAGVVLERVSPTGAAGRRGLRAGDRILAVGGAPVRSGEELRAAIGQAKSGHRSATMLTIRRGDHRARLTLPL